jgi:riboflavin kinase / FMN adenylyltransferase
MIIHKGYDNLKLAGSVVTLGIFDGVHIGHRALIDRLVSAAHQAGGESVVVTFFPHPRMVLENNKTDLSFLTTMEEKQKILEAAGIDHLIILEFNREFSNIPACDFLRDILLKRIGTRHLIIGYDHHFGRRGEGDFETIRHCRELETLKIEKINGVVINNKFVSSSSIRSLLLSGKLDEANSMLGYSYSLGGTVIHGKHLGRSIGFPTANINPDDKFKLIPGNGVYATEVVINDLIFKGMLSIGSNPTVNTDANAISIEVHIIGFNEDIYGSKISIRFCKRLRDERKFDNTVQLAEQMEIDKLETIRILS